MEEKSRKTTGMTSHKPKNIFVDGPISSSFVAASIEKHSSQTGIGAHSIFLGQVRADSVNDKKVVAIDYSTYEEMALEKMHVIREEVFARHDLICMHIYHSLGLVKAGEISLFVFTSSTHRNAAMAACEEIVERLKAELPVWGKELLEDKTFQWKENRP